MKECPCRNCIVQSICSDRWPSDEEFDELDKIFDEYIDTEFEIINYIIIDTINKCPIIRKWFKETNKNAEFVGVGKINYEWETD